MNNFRLFAIWRKVEMVRLEIAREMEKGREMEGGGRRRWREGETEIAEGMEMER